MALNESVQTKSLEPFKVAYSNLNPDTGAATFQSWAESLTPEVQAVLVDIISAINGE